ncbi:putative gustatory receptor 59b [Drosophila kikkawai]|uniref:Gustatory receptor n=1 Tax=Drosophila kikkawai TaxID=30033 RepID=A0ABM3C677_DROKI|nr:putative gustatory receptor 59b [Drosophila kikkawai]
MKLIARIYNVYTVVIGMTSYIFIRGKFRQTRLTHVYTFIVNAFTLTLLPVAYWEMAQIMTMVKWLPPFMWIAPYLLYSINYVVIAYTLISRCYRDAILVDLQLVIVQVDVEMLRTGRRISSMLQRLLLLKTCTLMYLFVAFFLSLVMYQWGMPWLTVLKGLLATISFTILVSTTFLHFLSFWQILRGFDFVNQQLEEITRIGSKAQAKELVSLWALHATLSRTARRINGYYGPQMLACRFDYFMFTIINGYFGTVYASYEHKLTIDKLLGVCIYWVRSLDFFLNDYICDLVTEYISEQGEVYGV